MEHRQRIVLPEGGEPRMLRAAAEITRRGLAGITLLGNPSTLQVQSQSCPSHIPLQMLLRRASSLGRDRQPRPGRRHPAGQPGCAAGTHVC